MPTESTRSRRKEKRIPSKLCVRCGGVKPLNEFYANKGWASQSFHDAWCRECAMKYCVDRETLQEYCWYNNRKWSEELYEGAAKKARYTLANDPVYLDASAPEEKRRASRSRTSETAPLPFSSCPASVLIFAFHLNHRGSF